jgi:hypothetical protein
VLRNPITGAACCAWATNGHAAKLPNPAMNSRRRISNLPRPDFHRLDRTAYSMTSSANNRIDVGTSIPNAFAIFRMPLDVGFDN